MSAAAVFASWPIRQSAATMPAMADWRQIQARIRKAKNSADARVKLSELYQRTHDAMVSWELGLVEEKAERIEEAIKWYTVSVERFRRSDWKKKAEEALTRLGAPIPAAGEKATQAPRVTAAASESTEDEPTSPEEPRAALALGEIPIDEEEDGAEDESATESAVAGAASTEGPTSETDAAGKKKRRRGRRGGRGRRRKGGVVAGSGLPTQAFAEQKAAPVAPAAQTSQSMPPRFQPAPIPARTERFERRPSAYAAEHESPSPASAEPFVPMLPSERTAHGRAGDPALASRMAKLDSMLRRLVASPLHKMDEADSAPAGPGVFLLSDSDQITSYYVEACQTLRVGLGNLVRGSGGGRSNVKPMRGGRQVSESGLKAKLAEHLGIGEAKVSQYLKDHCVVRWIQLDDDAAHLAHFAIGVLRTPLNTD